MTVELRPHFGWGDDDLKDMGGFVTRTSAGAVKAWKTRKRGTDFDNEELTAAAHEVWGDRIGGGGKLTREQRGAATTYADNGEEAEKLNRSCRTDEWPDDPIEGRRRMDMRDDLDDAVQKWETPRDITVYRGVRHFTQMKPGMEFRDDGFVSTSVEPGVGFTGDVHMKIRVPKGTKALPINGQSAFANEEELLIGRGHRFRVISITASPLPKPIPGHPEFAHYEAEVEMIA